MNSAKVKAAEKVAEDPVPTDAAKVAREKDDVRRLAEVVFTRRIGEVRIPSSEKERDRVIEEVALFSLSAAQMFVDSSDGWFNGEE